ncbi:hypothetical protein I79_024274 [Cricetulus griseus]|uniref:Uncharacterized protein n=1 Tax=Cricetulus griseus TaxID=10029 RepID=G3IK79_CRIGR|nr:hypothetical protein I79_024274 [Cricetulus griseus]
MDIVSSSPLSARLCVHGSAELSVLIRDSFGGGQWAVGGGQRRNLQPINLKTPGV